MKPIIALVGRPNVGKSTLFNRLTRTRDALVADVPGLTRDRLYGEGRAGEKPYLVVDTGGLAAQQEGIESLAAEQTWRAVEESDLILFMVDTRAGLTADDRDIALRLRRSGKPVILVVNKCEGLEPHQAAAEFHALGMGEPWLIAAAHGVGVAELMRHAVTRLPEAEKAAPAEEHGIKIAFAGRPNVGKSTLVNCLLGEDRVLVYDAPGTTRDSIHIPFDRKGKRYTLVDTAGVRRKGRVGEGIEKLSVLKTLQAIEEAQIVVLVLDALQGISDQDLHLAGFIIEAGRALVIAVNKWDGADADQRALIKRELERRLPFVKFAKTHFISALRGAGVTDLWNSINQGYASAAKDFSTSQLTRVLEQAVQGYQPPLVRGQRIKLRYAHQGGHHPPRIVIHGNPPARQTPPAYQRYLMGCFAQAFKLSGTPVRLDFTSSENPYERRAAGVVTPRHAVKRARKPGGKSKAGEKARAKPARVKGRRR
ncbi:MAG: ribosome biogenesis GTPase Der [Gammaproteobacteria bacterium]|nr:ribosome biogenesis GTPase Der [Gammaproteobacteria bacterium]